MNIDIKEAAAENETWNFYNQLLYPLNYSCIIILQFLFLNDLSVSKHAGYLSSVFCKKRGGMV